MKVFHRSPSFVRRFAAIAAGAILAVAAGFAAFHAEFMHQLARNSAQRTFGSQKLNVLLLGYQNDEGNSDTVLIAHLDVDRQTATLVSIPRDSWVAIPGHGHDKINAAIGYGGPKLTARIVSRLIGAPIDATLALQPDDAQKIVDAMGGLDVNVDEDMDYDDNAGGLHIHLQKGDRHLSGAQVVEYIRFRYDAASDWGRVRRQQQVIKDILNQMSAPQHWAKVPSVLAIASKVIKTNLTQSQILALLQIYRGVPDQNIRAFTMPGKAGWAGDASVVYLDRQWAKLIGRLLFLKQNPPADQVVVANATGNPQFDKTVVAALRGGGWNVPTFVDQPVKAKSRILGTDLAAQALANVFGTAVLRSAGRQTVLLLGTDLAPDVDG